MTYAAEVAENASVLKLWWRGQGSDSTLVDSSSQGNNGTINGGALQGQQGPLRGGEATGAVYLNGSGTTGVNSQYLRRPTVAAGDGLTGRGSGPYGDTWECWFKADIDTFTRVGHQYHVLFQERQYPVTGDGSGNVLVRVSIDALTGVWGFSFGSTGGFPVYFAISRPLSDWTDHLDCWRLVTLVRRTGSYLGVPVAQPGWHLYLDDTEVGYYNGSENLNITSGCVFNVGGDQPDIDRGTTNIEWELWKGYVAEPAYYQGQHSLSSEIIPRFLYRRPCGDAIPLLRQRQVAL